MEYIQVPSFDDFRAQEIYNSYIETFPDDERRNENQFRSLFTHPKVRVLSVLHDLQNIGYLVVWELTNFVFVDAYFYGKQCE